MGAGLPEGVERRAGASELRAPSEAGEAVMRPVASDDLARIVEIERSSFSTPWNAATFRKLLDRPDAEITVVDLPFHGVLGYSVLWCVRDQAELANIAVTEEWRGRGYGSALLDHVLRRARARGVRSVFLEVRESNERAAAMYAARGFEELGRRRGYYQNPREDARVLLKRLQ